MIDLATPTAQKSEEKPLLPPPGDPTIVEKVSDLWEESWRAKVSRSAVEARCSAFYDGYQWVRWSPEQGRLVPNMMFPRGVRPIVQNEIGHTVDQAVAILSSTQPSFVCPPSSGDEDDRNRADIATAVAEHIQETLETPEYDRLLKQWKAITGTAVLVSEWNDQAGPWDAVPGFDQEMQKATELVMGDDGPVPKRFHPDRPTMTKPRGALERHFYTSFETFPDPASTGPHDAAWVSFGFTVSPKEAERRWGITSEEVEKLKSDGRFSKLVALLKRAFSFPGGGGNTSLGQASVTGILGIKFYQAPCKEAPSGRCVMVLGGKVIYDKPCQTEGQFRFPFRVFTHGVNSKRWFPGGLVERMLEIQEELNRILTRYGQTVHLMGNPKIMVPGESGVNQKALTNAVAEIFRYNPGPNGEKPEYLQGITMPPSVMDYVRHLLATFQRIAGINESTMGVLPSSDTSGKAIQALQSRDTQRLAIISRADARQWAHVVRYELFLASRYWPDDYKINVVGKDLQPFILTFDKSMFPDPVDIKVVTGEGMPQDPQEAQAFINQLFAPGGPMMTLPPTMRRAWASLSKNASMKMLLMEENVYEVSTRRQIAKCRAGQRALVIYNDDHATARRILSRYMVGAEFEALDETQKRMVYDLETQHAQYDAMPKDGQGITLPPTAAMPAAPVPPAPGGPGTAGPPPNLQQMNEAAGMPPQVAPQGSPPAPAAAA